MPRSEPPDDDGRDRSRPPRPAPDADADADTQPLPFPLSRAGGHDYAAPGFGSAVIRNGLPSSGGEPFGDPTASPPSDRRPAGRMPAPAGVGTGTLHGTGDPHVFRDDDAAPPRGESIDAARDVMSHPTPGAPTDPGHGTPVRSRYRDHASGPSRGAMEPDWINPGEAGRRAHRMSVPPWNIHADNGHSGYLPTIDPSPPPLATAGVSPPPPIPQHPDDAPPQGLPPDAAAWSPVPGDPLPPPDAAGHGPSTPPWPSAAIAPPGVQTFRRPPSLDAAKVVNPRTSEPRSGWRRAVHRATRGHLNPGESRRDREHEQLVSQICQPIAGDFRIAVLSVKGGVGKTTTTVGLGSALAMVRHDRVIAVDANPDRGTLAERVHDTSTESTVRDLLTDPNITRYADIRGHTRMSVSRLEVLASEQDPAAADVFDEADYRRTVDILGHYYTIILTDCGTGIMHSAMAGVLELAHSIVLVSSPAMDAVTSASATLDWLMQHGHSRLVRQGHVVLSATGPGSAALKLDKVSEFFRSRCRSIHVVPFDPHLAEGADVDFGLLKPMTRQTYLELAGAVVRDVGQVRAHLA